MARLALLLFIAATCTATAKDNGQWAQTSPPVRDWFKKQQQPTTKMWCCNEADGEQVDEEIRAGRYWINSDKTGGVWMIVPEEVVIKEPNLFGRPVAWYRKDMNGETQIFCYAPGPLL